MTPKSSFASQWRIDLAAELMEHYKSQEHIKMIVLGGSPSRGLSDSYSDLDIVVYWDTVNSSWLDTIPLSRFGAERPFFHKMKDEDVYLEQYYFDTLKVDVGHVTLKLWKKWVEDVLERFDMQLDLHKTLGGFLASKVLYGEQLAEEWKKRIAKYPDQLAVKMVKQHLKFFNFGVLQHQGLERGDIIFFYDGICMMLKNFLGILAGLNKVYFSPAEPRWIEYELKNMPVQPQNAWKRMKSLFEVDRSEVEDILEELTIEVLDLVAAHMPDIDLTRIRKFSDFSVRACDEKPILK
ncbi:MAG: hypothetical protein A2161_19650 [Candidatus Schekmanbacteria bacterium RBG_13_48_7]|uniref:Uncharacterized protein n=1 Tax=Candidatus Schekmanbacteria bacterium RBG_13_48_7 TaxID=1817878 RepID=A0A1F7RKQ7_9BACT|nr:MAG: hypothetical protein A2161_19650 [Candidatus Schekmanbacteria bacterium RBG_13_48_7]